MHLERTTRLTPDQVTGVLSLVARAAITDGVAPLSEHVLLSVRGETGIHLLAASGADLVGYAHLTPSITTGAATDPATAELVVEVAARRHGVGHLLLDRLVQETLPLQVWAHGHLPAAEALAARDGFSVTRELWQLRRPLGSGGSGGPVVAVPPQPLPEGFRDRAFVVGQDEQAWLAVNASAFAHYPEQGGITRHDLDQRIAEPWFDAEGFRLVEDERSDPPTLAAYHWTKVHDATSPDGVDNGGQAIGEVYVVGVDPAYQGQGLGGPVTALGLRHLQDRGLTRVLLYVDSDNVRAIATYRRLGFTDWHIDALYLRTESA